MPRSHSDVILEQLEQADRDLLAAGLGDVPALEAALARRAAVIQQAAEAIDALRPAAEHQAAFARSREAGAQAMRQLILAKHLLSTELAHLRREQRLWESLAGEGRGAARIDCRG